MLLLVLVRNQVVKANVWAHEARWILMLLCLLIECLLVFIIRDRGRRGSHTNLNVLVGLRNLVLRMSWHVLLLLLAHAAFSLRLYGLLSVLSVNDVVWLFAMVVIVVSSTVELLCNLYRLPSNRDRSMHAVHALTVLHLRVHDRLAHVEISCHHSCCVGVMHSRRTGRHLTHHV